MNPVTFQRGIKPRRNDFAAPLETKFLTGQEVAGFHKCNGMKIKQFSFFADIAHRWPGMFARDNVLFGGIILVAVFLVALIALDGYVFDQTVWRPQETVIVTPKKTAVLSDQDIDGWINILEERSKKSEEILGALNPVLPRATSSVTSVKK